MLLFSAPTRGLRGAVLGLCVALATAFHAQTASPPTTTLTAHTELVSVPVVVTDKSGAHVRGLRKEDFTLLEEGKEQAVAVFEEIQKSNVTTPRSPRPTDQFSNVPPEGSSRRQLTIVVLDMVNTLPADQIYAKEEIIKYLADPGNADQSISLLALNRTGVRLIHHFSSDRAELAAALNRVDRSQPPVTEDPTEAFLTNAKDRLSKNLQSFGEFQVDAEQAALSFDRRRIIMVTLQSMRQIAQAFAGLPGRKTLVWAGGGFPFTINETNMALKEAGAGLDTLANLAPLYESTWAALNQAQISVYPVDVHGLGELPGPSASPVPVKKPLPDPFTHGQWLHAGVNGTFETFARATAGRAFFNKNGLQAAIHEAVDDSASYYLLAYYLRREGKKPGWRKLGVKVNREGVQVLARTGFFLKAPGAKSEDTSKDSMEAALDSPLDYTAIPITAKWQEAQAAPEPGKKKVIFVLTMPAGFADVDESNRNHFAFDFWAAARTPAGVAAGDSEQTMEGYFKPETLERFRSKGTDYRGALSVAPGEYTVRFVVRDRLSGRIGTVAAPLKVSP